MAKESTISKIYSGTASFGAIMSDINAIIGTIIGIIMIIVGIVLENHKAIYSLVGNGIVQKNNLIPFVDSKNGNSELKWTGTIDVINNKDTTKTSQTFQINDMVSKIKPYPENTTIVIYINPKDPTDFRILSDDTSIIGWVLIITGVVIIISAWVWAYFANKYKIIGAFQGVTTGIDYIKNL